MSPSRAPGIPVSPELLRPFRIWIGAIIAVVLVMVSIGGITRLTGAGLSITEWAPVMGAVPPLSADAWRAEFAKYQASPQYLKLNAGIPLSEFKFLYFWEWFHRLVARSLGFVAALPALYFFARKKLPRALLRRLVLGVALGGLQGLMGWLMVKSGLVDEPRVSHYRLAAHLGLALLILYYFVYLYRDLRAEGTTPVALAPEERARFGALRGLKHLLYLQILYGAFVAGLKAGFGFNTFPKMLGEWVPSSFWDLSPKLANLVQNPASVQWIHRTVGWVALWATLAFVARGLGAFGERGRFRDPSLRFWTKFLGGMIVYQFTLGVLTLLYVVPIPLAVLHQFGAAVIILILAQLSHRFARDQA